MKPMIQPEPRMARLGAPQDDTQPVVSPEAHQEEPILPQTMSFEHAPQTNEQEVSYEAPINDQLQEVASPEAILPAQISPEAPENAGVIQPAVAQDEEPLPQYP
eukprot:89513_1